MDNFDDSIFLMVNMNGNKLKLIQFSGNSCNLIFSCPSDKPEEMAEHLADNFTSLIDGDLISMKNPCSGCKAKKCFRRLGNQLIPEDDFLNIIEMVKRAPGEELVEACMDNMENY